MRWEEASTGFAFVAKRWIALLLRFILSLGLVWDCWSWGKSSRGSRGSKQERQDHWGWGSRRGGKRRSWDTMRSRVGSSKSSGAQARAVGPGVAKSLGQ